MRFSNFVERFTIHEYFLRYFRRTSPYGWRIHPISKVRSHHNGIDYAPRSAPWNPPIPSPIEGIVWSTGNFGGRGLCVTVRIQGTNEMLLFQHLARIDTVKGRQIREGQSIGLMGTTGNSTGVHLHAELRTYDGRNALGSGVYGDPSKYVIVKEPSIAEIWRRTFEERRQRLMEMFKR